ncbi:MAG: hypothetical protein ABI685_00945 [Ferruginibacter sp.]
MKKSILMLGVLFLINMESKAQEAGQFIAANSFPSAKLVSLSSPYYNNPDKDYDYYMRKSKRSRTTGLILLGSGVLISGVGAILSFGNGQGYIYNQSKGDAGAAMLLIGAAAGIASIPFMAIALGHSNKAKAILSSQKTGFGVPSNVSKDIVGVTIQIRIPN